MASASKPVPQTVTQEVESADNNFVPLHSVQSDAFDVEQVLQSVIVHVEFVVLVYNTLLLLLLVELAVAFVVFCAG
mgnify:CR=1 FL=1